MKIYLNDYIKEIDKLLQDKIITKEDINNHLIKIGFFQHERLIHLLVTLFYAFIALLFLVLGCFVHYMFFPIAIILLIFLMFYVVHYFRLENGVQYLYKQYDKMLNNK